MFQQFSLNAVQSKRPLSTRLPSLSDDTAKINYIKQSKQTLLKIQIAIKNIINLLEEDDAYDIKENPEILRTLEETLKFLSTNDLMQRLEESDCIIENLKQKYNSTYSLLKNLIEENRNIKSERSSIPSSNRNSLKDDYHNIKLDNDYDTLKNDYFELLNKCNVYEEQLEEFNEMKEENDKLRHLMNDDEEIIKNLNDQITILKNSLLESNNTKEEIIDKNLKLKDENENLKQLIEYKDMEKKDLRKKLFDVNYKSVKMDSQINGYQNDIQQLKSKNNDSQLLIRNNFNEMQNYIKQLEHDVNQFKIKDYNNIKTLIDEAKGKNIFFYINEDNLELYYKDQKICDIKKKDKTIKKHTKSKSQIPFNKFKLPLNIPKKKEEKFIPKIKKIIKKEVLQTIVKKQIENKEEIMNQTFNNYNINRLSLTFFDDENIDDKRLLKSHQKNNKKLCDLILDHSSNYDYDFSSSKESLKESIKSFKHIVQNTLKNSMKNSVNSIRLSSSIPVISSRSSMKLINLMSNSNNNKDSSCKINNNELKEINEAEEIESFRIKNDNDTNINEFLNKDNNSNVLKNFRGTFGDDKGFECCKNEEFTLPRNNKILKHIDIHVNKNYYLCDNDTKLISKIDLEDKCANDEQQDSYRNVNYCQTCNIY